ncbi:MAG: methyltransferase [Candidatus Diapherotrites archaeon]
MKKVFFKDFELVVYDHVYEPAEDSFLLAENVKVLPGIKALDVGCGCGIQSINLLSQGAFVTATDINKHALKNTLKNAKIFGFSKKIKVLYGDLFEPVKRRKFDVIVFNPPYLPTQGKKDIALDGGKKGCEILHRFLDNLPKHLNKGGCCYFVQSSLTGEKNTKKKLKELNLKFEMLARERLFFEELIVFKTFL